jgi:hypothetical protein
MASLSFIGIGMAISLLKITCDGQALCNSDENLLLFIRSPRPAAVAEGWRERPEIELPGTGGRSETTPLGCFCIMVGCSFSLLQLLQRSVASAWSRSELVVLLMKLCQEVLKTAPSNMLRPKILLQPT